MSSLSNYEKNLLQLCEVLHIGFDLGIELHRQDLTCLGLMHKFDMPGFMDSVSEAYIKTMSRELELAGHNAVVYHTFGKYPLMMLDIKLAQPERPVYYISIGPFATQPVTQTLILELLHKNAIPMSFRQSLYDFLSAFPILSERTPMIALLAVTHLNNNLEFPALSVRYVSDQQVFGQIATGKKASQEQIQLRSGEIAAAYHAEHLMRAAITAGNKQKAREVSEIFITGDLTDRTPGNPMRTHRNLSYSSNTIYRLAAIDGGITPATAHQISDGFARKIENLNNYAEIDILNRQMIDAYCDAVHDAQTQNYSAPVKNAIQHLKMNFDSAQSLKQVASAINYSPSHLSHLFIAETGQTIGEYLNALRIREAIAILDSDQFEITDVALMVGFSSYSYFSEQFRKITGMTCREYLKRHRGSPKG